MVVTPYLNLHKEFPLLVRFGWLVRFSFNVADQRELVLKCSRAPLHCIFPHPDTLCGTKKFYDVDQESIHLIFRYHQLKLMKDLEIKACMNYRYLQEIMQLRNQRHVSGTDLPRIDIEMVQGQCVSLWSLYTVVNFDKKTKPLAPWWPN